jgi:predicted oxidoreductase (fatty acid repression mutant protein)
MMERSFSEALKQRRTYYSITNQSPISDQEIECIDRASRTVSIQFTDYTCGAPVGRIS